MCLAFCCFNKNTAVLSIVLAKLALFFFQLGNVRNKYDADEQAAIQHYEVRAVFDLKRLETLNTEVIDMCTLTVWKPV